MENELSIYLNASEVTEDCGAFLKSMESGGRIPESLAWKMAERLEDSDLIGNIPRIEHYSNLITLTKLGGKINLNNPYNVQTIRQVYRRLYNHKESIRPPSLNHL